MSRFCLPLHTENFPRPGTPPGQDKKPLGTEVVLLSSAAPSQRAVRLTVCPHPGPSAQPGSTYLELALEWPKDRSLLQDMGGTYTGSCLEVQEGGRTGHFLTAFWPLQVL